MLYPRHVPYSVDHVLLTRFNLPSPGPERLIRASSGWLARRVTLFESFCLPSVVRQSSGDFRWIIYSDPESPDWLRDKLSELSEGGRLFTAIYRESVPRPVLVADIRRVVGNPGSLLLTTNLDNDDAIASDFVERVQALGRESIVYPTALFLARGLIKSEKRLYLRQDPTNAFCSVIETWDAPVCCWSEWHNLLGQRMPVRAVGGKPGWLQVVHGGNVSNRVRGRLTSSEGYRDLFPDAAVRDIREPNRAEVFRDRFLLGPGRAMREGLRGATKWVLMSTVGKDGLDKSKELLGDLHNVLVGVKGRVLDLVLRAGRS